MKLRLPILNQNPSLIYIKRKGNEALESYIVVLRIYQTSCELVTYKPEEMIEPKFTQRIDLVYARSGSRLMTGRVGEGNRGV